MNRPALFPAAVLFLFLTASGSVAVAQSGFRVSHQVTATAPTHVEVTGTVTNETRADAVDVSVTVEAIGARGKAAARGIAYVASRLRAGSSAPFAVKVPVVPGITEYRAGVSSFRFVQSIEGP